MFLTKYAAGEQDGQSFKQHLQLTLLVETVCHFPDADTQLAGILGFSGQSTFSLMQTGRVQGLYVYQKSPGRKGATRTGVEEAPTLARVLWAVRRPEETEHK